MANVPVGMEGSIARGYVKSYNVSLHDIYERTQRDLSLADALQIAADNHKHPKLRPDRRFMKPEDFISESLGGWRDIQIPYHLHVFVSSLHPVEYRDPMLLRTTFKQFSNTEEWQANLRSFVKRENDLELSSMDNYVATMLEDHVKEPLIWSMHPLETRKPDYNPLIPFGDQVLGKYAATTLDAAFSSILDAKPDGTSLTGILLTRTGDNLYTHTLVKENTVPALSPSVLEDNHTFGLTIDSIADSITSFFRQFNAEGQKFILESMAKDCAGYSMQLPVEFLHARAPIYVSTNFFTERRATGMRVLLEGNRFWGIYRRTDRRRISTRCQVI